ncbi:uncharacterized protein METZ01_LOCUS306464 [marine metagenome]|uniref:Uncharacterized protein n=1 Tax=marine metagenome TaxID=408172 RepID=A0A382MYK6_9ZZZZ
MEKGGQKGCWLLSQANENNETLENSQTIPLCLKASGSWVISRFTAESPTIKLQVFLSRLFPLEQFFYRTGNHPVEEFWLAVEVF